VTRAGSLFAVLAVVGMVAAGCGDGGGGQLSLRAVEKAFHDAKIPFAVDWQRAAANPYLIRRTADNPTSQYPSSFARHVAGWADFVDLRTYVSRSALVFDNSASAAAFARWWGHHSTGNQAGYLRSKNVVYIGQLSQAVTRVMNTLGS